MKKLLVTVLSIILSAVALADCRKSYEHASHSRDLRNEVIVGVAIVGFMGGAVLVPAGAAVFSATYFLFLAGAWPAIDFKRQGVEFYSNHFDKVINSFDSGVNGKTDKLLTKLINKTVSELEIEETAELKLRVRTLFVDGFNNNDFCPVIKIRRDGTEKRAVFNHQAIVKYLIERL